MIVLKMKKIILIICVLLASFIELSAQNANRSGLFIEAGGGYLLGTVPVSKLEWKDNALKILIPDGPDINLAVGYRGATSSVFAWQIKAELSTVPPDFETTMVLAFMPGIRLTTKELFGNTSLYFGLDAGFALGRSSSYSTRYLYFPVNGEEYDEITRGGLDSVGMKMGLSVGMNFTSKFYGGFYCDYNLIFDQVNRNSFKDMEIHSYFDSNEIYFPDNKNLWGSVGVRLGYRF